MSSKGSNEFVIPFIFVLVFSLGFAQNGVVFGSSVREQSFKRHDPLNHFRYYRGGYNVTNKHYWASAAFTGIHGYAIAGILILCGMAYGIYMIFKHFSHSASSVMEHSHSSFLIMFLLVLLFFSLAIVATGLVIAANQNCLLRTKKLKDTTLGAADEAQRTIYNVTQTMDEMQRLLLPYDSKTPYLLNVTSHRLASESQTIQDFVKRYERKINKAIQTTYMVNLLVVTFNLAFLVAGIVTLLLHWRPGFLVIIFCCWILTTLSWVLTGFDFVVHTFAKDTCTALKDFEENPHENVLSSILPCIDPLYAEKVLVQIGYIVHNSINELNSKITGLSGLMQSNKENNFPSHIVRTICNPFSGAPNYGYVPEDCPKESLLIGDLPGVLSRFTCYQAHVADCGRSGRFIPETSYAMAWAYSNAIDDLIKIFPELKGLLQCSFVKDTFSIVVLHQCKPYKASTKKLWISVLCLSVFMMVFMLLLAAKAYQDKGKTWSHCSVFPNSRV